MSTVHNVLHSRIDAPVKTARQRGLSLDDYVASVVQVNATRFHVRSQSRPSSVREVRLHDDGNLTCSCPSRLPCKHIHAVEAWIEESLMPVEVAVCECYGCRTRSSLGCYRNLQESDWQWIRETA